MNAVLAILFLLTFGRLCAAELFVDPGGSDQNDCSSPAKACAAIQSAVDRVGFATTQDILLAPGDYLISQMINVYYWRGMQVRGPRDHKGDCAMPTATIVATRDLVAFWVQDGAILIVSCVRIIAGDGVKSLTAFGARQGAIVDFGPGVRFGPMGQYVSIVDGGKASCIGKIYLEGDAIVGFGAAKGSLLNLGCPMVLTPGMRFSTAFIQARNTGTNVDISHATFSIDDQAFSPDGSAAGVLGRPYMVDNAELTKGMVTIPGDVEPEQFNYAIVR